LRAPRKFGLRLSRLGAQDAPDILRLLRAYLEHESGEIAREAWPEGLKSRLTACVPPPHLLGGERSRVS
jgi:predicted metal-binding protein